MSKGLKYCAILLISIVIVSVPHMKANAATVFSDLGNTEWAADEIQYIYNKGIIKGYSIDGKQVFKPNNKVTRAQAAKMISIAMGKGELKPDKPTFSDVSEKHWAFGWIERTINEGYFNGYEDKGTFNPDGELTRAQMTKIISKAFNINVEAAAGKPLAFTDIKENWASHYINTLYYAGIATGDNGQFRPLENINRAQFSVFLARAINDEFKETPKPVTPKPSKYIANAMATVSSLNVRSAANSTSPVIGSLKRGETVGVYGITGYWAKVNYKGKTGYVHKTYLKLKNINANPLQGRIITIDAGHGGRDSGTTKGSTYEKNITLDVAKRVDQRLKRDGAKIIMTRESDTYPTLSDRVRISTNNYAELFVSIHVNSAGATSANGSETFYNSTNGNSVESKEVAREIQKQLVSLVGMYDRGVKDGDFHVIREQNTPAVLVELGFITNSKDYAKLTSSKYLDLYAEAIYRGIKNYYSK
ncbi:N-acetylmuramoyl-L-alanine amidase [Oikeobacillus pervagus]|uniref:N-acetylmuramoyl-L-alanine amidase n=1 Tax=Oikeobacillus pervagus TaxID=1325931 RepID=A0AAJ1T1Y1_9BACI|nr:N-acetylmuramoyl-L-alanine amidase [Oikeobacillus pervagus]MDQ0215302.1 N-acetylmuramoyl-L-alanine amidase [Oikeobacillus pervagus]